MQELRSSAPGKRWWCVHYTRGKSHQEYTDRSGHQSQNKNSSVHFSLQNFWWEQACYYVCNSHPVCKPSRYGTDCRMPEGNGMQNRITSDHNMLIFETFAQSVWVEHVMQFMFKQSVADKKSLCMVEMSGLSSKRRKVWIKMLLHVFFSFRKLSHRENVNLGG